MDADQQRPRAVSEYLVERMLLAGATRLCFVVSSTKADIMHYFGGRIGGAAICYVVKQEPRGLCDALFSSLPFIAPDDEVLVGLPDTIWFPADGFQLLTPRQFSFLLFLVQRPELFDAVRCDDLGFVQEVQVKVPAPDTNWVWGALRLPASTFAELHALWLARDRSDEFLGSLVNAHIARGGIVSGVKRGEVYVDVGTINGYHQALRVLSLSEVTAF